MADKGPTSLAAASALTGTEVFHGVQSGNSRKVSATQISTYVRTFRGALVRKSVDQTAADYTGTPAIAWDQEVYDTDAIHDSGSNTRLTVPAGVTYVRLSACVRLGSVTGDMFCGLGITKGGSASYDGRTFHFSEVGNGAPGLAITSPVLAVAAGEYFECTFQVETDTSITVTAATSWFAMEIIA